MQYFGDDLNLCSDGWGWDTDHNDTAVNLLNLVIYFSDWMNNRKWYLLVRIATSFVYCISEVGLLYVLFLDATQEVSNLLRRDFGWVFIAVLLLLYVYMLSKGQGRIAGSQLLCTGTWPGACRHTHVTISSLHLMNALQSLHIDHKSASDRHN